ncbi:hypothetical protein HDV00_003357 [Rhizophlyctis rosea]|nr:hypothetical protein HDV00_003357 [Rhizophlyctis rosea]
MAQTKKGTKSAANSTTKKAAPSKAGANGKETSAERKKAKGLPAEYEAEDSFDMLSGDARQDLPIANAGPKAKRQPKRKRSESSEGEAEDTEHQGGVDEQLNESSASTKGKGRSRLSSTNSKRGKSKQSGDEIGSKKAVSGPTTAEEQSVGGRSSRTRHPPNQWWAVQGQSASPNEASNDTATSGGVGNVHKRKSKSAQSATTDEDRTPPKAQAKSHQKGSSKDTTSAESEHEETTDAPAAKRQRKGKESVPTKQRSTKKAKPAEGPEEDQIAAHAEADDVAQQDEPEPAPEPAAKQSAPSGRGSKQTRKSIAKDSAPTAENESGDEMASTSQAPQGFVSAHDHEMLRLEKEDLQARYDALKTRTIDEANTRFETYKKSIEQSQKAQQELITRLKTDVESAREELTNVREQYESLEAQLEETEKGTRAATKRAETAEKAAEDLRLTLKEVKAKSKSDQRGSEEESDTARGGKNVREEDGSKKKLADMEKERARERAAAKKEKEDAAKQWEQQTAALDAKIVKLEAEVGEWKDQAQSYKTEAEEWEKKAGGLEDKVKAWKKKAAEVESEAKEWKKKAGRIDDDVKLWEEQVKTTKQDADSARHQFSSLHAQYTALQERMKESASAVGSEQYLRQLESRIRMYEELTGVVMQGVEDARQVVERDGGEGGAKAEEEEEAIEIYKCVMKGRKGVLNFNLYIPQRITASTEYTYVPAGRQSTSASGSSSGGDTKIGGMVTTAGAGGANAAMMELPQYLQDAMSFPRNMTGLFFWRVCNYVQGDD